LSALPDSSDGKLSRASAQRLSQYLRCVAPAARAGLPISSEALSEAVGVSAAQVRRDLGAIGHSGLRGIGYDAAGLAAAIRKKLGLNRQWRTVLVGVGNLARALLRHRGFAEQGFEIVALFDSDTAKIGTQMDELIVQDTATLSEGIPCVKAELAILTVPSDAAQIVADQLVKAGIKGIMNFAPVLLKTPSSVHIITVDLAIQMEQLAFAVQVGEG